MVDRHEQEVTGSWQTGLIHTDNRIVIAGEQKTIPGGIASPTGHDAEVAGGHSQTRSDRVPVEDEIAGGPFDILRDAPDARGHPGQLRALIGWAEHHHPLHPGQVGGGGQCHPPSDHEVAETVAHETERMPGGLAGNHFGERPAVGIDVGLHTCVAEQDHGGIKRRSEVISQRSHGIAALSETVEQNDRGALLRRDRAVGLQGSEGCPALCFGAGSHGAIAGVQNPARLLSRVPLEPPVVADLRIGPLESLPRPAEGRQPALGGDGRIGGHQDSRQDSNGEHPGWPMATKCRVGSAG